MYRFKGRDLPASSYTKIIVHLYNQFLLITGDLSGKFTSVEYFDYNLFIIIIIITVKYNCIIAEVLIRPDLTFSLPYYA